MYKIAKQFDFCYGHRVWSQELNSEYSLDSCLKCRHFHGHQGKIIVFLESTELNDGMVTDFKHLNWFKQWIDDTLDHKSIYDINDPLWKENQVLPGITLNNLVKTDIDGKHWFMAPGPWMYTKKPSATNEIYEGLIFVPFVPTSENLSKWIFDIVQERMKPLGVKVSQVQFFETPKSQSNYYV